MTLRIPLETGASGLHVRFGQTQARLEDQTLVVQAPPRSGVVIALDT
jgi:hypothetical protein